MKRLAMFLLVIGGCAAQDSLAPELGGGGPSLAVIADGDGGITFASGSACTSALQVLTCNYTIENLPEDVYDITVTGVWNYTYQCVHAKTGKPSRKYPPTEATYPLHRSEYSVAPDNGAITRTGQILSALALLSTVDQCSSNKGAFTATQILYETVTPTNWSIYISSVTQYMDYWASLSETL
jgi:hypothetical protein